LPDVSWYNVPKRGKIYQNRKKYNKKRKNITNGKNVTKRGKIYQMTLKSAKCHKIYQVDGIYVCTYSKCSINIPIFFRSKALQNIPKLYFLV
jgi:hypothetical protein